MSVPAWTILVAGAHAACDPAAPASGQTVTCTGTNLPAFIAAAGVTGLSVNVTSGSSITGVATTVAGANAQRSSVRINDASTITNNGTISPTLGAAQQRDYVGVNLNGTNATLVNNGDITVTNNATLAGSGTYRLYGVITSNDSGAPEFENVTVRNLGNITVTQSGAGIARGTYAGEDIGSMIVENFGTISATRIGNAGSTNAVGAIDSDDDVEELSIINHQGATLSSTGANTYTIQGRAGETEISNEGTITQSGGNGAAILIWRGTNTGPATVELENESTGIINGDVYLVDRNPNTGNSVANGFARDSTVENEGRINGNVFLGKGAHVFENEGTITGNITVDQIGNQAYSLASIQGARTFALTNSGTIGGNLTIFDSNLSVNTVTLVTGSSIGNITAVNGVGNNSLVLSAPGGGGDDDDDDAPASAVGTLNSNVSGFRTLTQTGGTWTLAEGTTQTFSQRASINGGTLYVNSFLTAPVIAVGEDGTLGGTGTLNGNVTNDGVVAPGSAANPYGTLTVTGNHTQTDDGRFVVAANAAGANAFLQVNGTATLAGNVQLVGAAGTYAPGTAYTVLRANGGLNGEFDTVTKGGAIPTLLAPEASYVGNDVILTLMQQSFGLVAQTPNQQQTAIGFDALLAGNTTALTYLDNLSDARVAQILDGAGGQGYAALADSQLRAGRAFGDTLVQRAYQGVFEAGPSGFTLPPAVYAADLPRRGPVPEPKFIPTTRGYSVWATGYGQTGTVNQTVNTSAVNSTILGFAGGVDMYPSVGTVLGIAAGYGSVDASLTRTGERAHTDNAQVGVYGGFTSGAFYGVASAGYAHTEGKMNRALPGLQPFQPGGATGNINGDQFLSAGEVGFRFVATPRVSASPFVGYQVTTFNQDRVNENSGGLFDLTVAQKDFLSARAMVGLRLESSFDVAGRPVTFGVKGAFVNDFADVSRTIQSAFALAPEAPFFIRGRPLDRQRALVGFGLAASIADGWTGFANFDSEYASSDQIYAGRGGVRYSF